MYIITMLLDRVIGFGGLRPSEKTAEPQNSRNHYKTPAKLSPPAGGISFAGVLKRFMVDGCGVSGLYFSGCSIW